MSHSPIVPLSPRPQVESGWLPPPRSSSFNRSEYRNIASPSPFPFPLLQFLRGGRNIFVVRFFLGGQSDSIFTDSPLPFDSSPFDVLPLWNAAQRFLHPTPSSFFAFFFFFFYFPLVTVRGVKRKETRRERRREKRRRDRREESKKENGFLWVGANLSSSSIFFLFAKDRIHGCASGFTNELFERWGMHLFHKHSFLLCKIEATCLLKTLLFPREGCYWMNEILCNYVANFSPCMCVCCNDPPQLDSVC